MGPHILLIEGQGARDCSCAPLLEEKGFQLTRVYTRKSAYAGLETSSPDLLIVDARFLRFNASRFCESLHTNGHTAPLLLILPEESQDPPAGGATVVLQEAVTPRKLLNRVNRLLSQPGAEMLRAGNITLDLKRRVVVRDDQEYRLTPQQARLLQVLMRNAGRVLTRAFLMREVWETDFLDDTRTLEVHIHWLRKAIEQDPSRPVYLTTVRRLGYRFDAP